MAPFAHALPALAPNYDRLGERAGYRGHGRNGMA
jgi:hypothetical protein